VNRGLQRATARWLRFTVHGSPVLLLTLLSPLLACRATTQRPAFVPLPAAAVAEVELDIPSATRALAEGLATDSIVLTTIHEADGYIDSGWLDAATLERTGRKPPGPEVVRVRAWVNPGRPFWSELVVEASFRALADPSRPQRELDVALPDAHPLQRRIGRVLAKLVEAHGDPATLPRAIIAPDSLRARPDSLRPRPDTTKPNPDTLRS